MSLLISLLINALAIVISAKIFSGVQLDSITTAILVAVIVAVLNWTIKPILLFFTLPITLLTFGLFTLVINTLILLIASRLVVGFSFSSFGTAFLFSIVLSIISSLLHALFDE